MTCEACNDTGLTTHRVEKYGISLVEFCDRCSFGTALWREHERSYNSGLRTGLIWGAIVFIVVWAFTSVVLL